jgi:hypothetical protein
MWPNGLSVYGKNNRVDWKWKVVNGVITKAPLEGKKYRTKSLTQTDRSKSGTRLSTLVDGKGVPIGVSVDCANGQT